jgi:P2-related tail formation protein
MMRVDEVEILRLLPLFMRDDSAIKGLSAGADAVLRQIAYIARLQSTWDRINDLDEGELDTLALELGIAWYLTDAGTVVKRRLIHESDLVYSKLGTKYAVEEVISAYFGDGMVIEWFDYAGDPFHFKVLSTNPLITNERLGQFLWLLGIVKRESAWLDEILITLTQKMHLHYGEVFHDTAHETYTMTGGRI